MGKFDGSSDLTIFNSQSILLGTGLYFNNGKITIDNSHLTNHLQNTFSDLYIDEYFKNYANCMYKIDKGLDSELIFDSSTRKISKLKDNTLYELDANQNVAGNQPKLCTKANKINNRYHIEFNSTNSERMISQIDLNPGTNQQDIVNIFIVYKLNSRLSVNYWVNNGLFGHDNGGFDKFVCFGKNGTNGEESLMIAGINGADAVIIGPHRISGYNPISDYKTNANAGELNKWICLSIHWDVPGSTNKSSVWCNNQQLALFTAGTSPGSTQMTFGDIDPGGIAPLDGSIAFFGLYKGFVLSDDLIKLHHKVLCNRYSINKSS